jgi:hypothetical protein
MGTLDLDYKVTWVSSEKEDFTTRLQTLEENSKLTEHVLLEEIKNLKMRISDLEDSKFGLDV